MTSAPSGARFILVCFVATAQFGCGESPLPGDGVDLRPPADLAMAAQVDSRSPTDSASSPADAADLAAPPADLLAPSPDLAGFCADPNSPRIELNGMFAATPAVAGHTLALNCCFAATIDFVSMQIAQPISVVWRHQVGLGPNPPVTLDLANLPMGWSVSLWSGCGPAQPNCQPTDRVDVGLHGSLTVSGNPGGFQMSACIDATPGGGQPVIHSVRLWSGSVTAR